MCGIAGLVHLTGAANSSETKASATAMIKTIAHRGPDGEGIWCDYEARLALAHRRLSVIDLTEAGRQPMLSHSGRFVMSYNGEIYNFLAMKASLEDRFGAMAWRGRTDSEVLLECCAHLGLRETLSLADGMFAIALYDRRNRVLSLARDAFGEKPLYYGRAGGVFAFASELRAFEALPESQLSINRDALAAFFAYSYIPAPYTIWEGIWKLRPGHLISIRLPDLGTHGVPEPENWCDLTSTALLARAAPFSGTREEAVEVANQLLMASVNRRLKADVPMGSLLSGGIDSSVVTALMQGNACGATRSFSIGMDKVGFNEAPAARAVAQYLGTRHTEQILSPETVLDEIPKIATRFDEPFADSSQVPTYLVSKMARDYVTVALSGDGGDELFAGYNRHFQAPRFWRKLARLPYPARRVLSQFVSALPAHKIDRVVTGLGRLAPTELASGQPSVKVIKLARALAEADINAFHSSLLTTGPGAAFLADAGVSAVSLVDTLPPAVGELPLSERAQLLDTGSYLPDDVLTKVDRASMAVSLEVRTPFLERELFRFVWSLPLQWRGDSPIGKPLLRDVLYRYVPRELVERPKAGFAIPLAEWLRGGLRSWADAELARSSLMRSGLLDPDPIRRIWEEFLAGQVVHAPAVWNVLMFQSWFQARTS